MAGSTARKAAGSRRRLTKPGPAAVASTMPGSARRLLGDGGGEFRRRLAGGLGGDQCGVGRHVAVRRIARGRDFHPRGDVVRQVGHGAAQRVEHLGTDGLEQVGHEGVMRAMGRRFKGGRVNGQARVPFCRARMGRG